MARGRGPGKKRLVRESILRRHGLNPKPKKPKFPKANTTLAMRLLERVFKTPIRELLEGPSLRVIAKRLGVHESTVIKWRKRLDGTTEPRRLPEMETRLP